MKKIPRYKSHAVVYPLRLTCSHVMATAPRIAPMKWCTPPMYTISSTSPERTAPTASEVTIS